MKEELFKLYCKTHFDNTANFLILILTFIVGRLYFYNLSGMPDFLTCGILLFLSTFFFAVEFRLLNTLRKMKKIPSELMKSSIHRLTACKTAYFIPFMAFLFWPIKVNYLYDLLVGFGFIFVALIVLVSLSGGFLRMLVREALLLLVSGLAIIAVNIDVQETPYIGIAMLFFSAFIFNMALGYNHFATELLKKRADLEKAVRKSEFAVRAKSEFLAVISHEIRTPMNGIIGMIDFLKESKLSKQQEEYIDTIMDCSRTLLNTLNDVLDISKIESGKFTIDKISFDLHGLLKGISKIIETTAKQKDLVFMFERDPELPTYMASDPNRIQQVTINLLNNAVKFTDTGIIHLKALYKPVEKVIRIEVHDTGIGISQQQQKKLFENFSQADSSITRKFGGTGLGLSIAKQLITLMGGVIGVESTPGEGSVFWFEVPYAEPSSVISQDGPVVTGSVSNLRILLADDNHINQMIVSRILTNLGNEVKTCHDGQQALSAAKVGDFDLILMDLHMPGMDGITATEKIRALGGKHKTIPIIALTANLMEEHLKAALKAGMVDYISKPIDKKIFLETIYKNLPPHLQAKAVNMTASHNQIPEGMQNKINAIREEFGQEFSVYFLQENINEVGKILANFSRAIATSNLEQVFQHAHDLGSVSGNVGMEVTSEIARKIELLSQEKKFDEILMAYGSLVRESEAELALVKSLLKA